MELHCLLLLNGIALLLLIMKQELELELDELLQDNLLSAQPQVLLITTKLG